MNQLDLKKKVAMVLPYLQAVGWVANPPPCDISDRLRQIVQAAGDRIKMAGDILQFDEMFVADQDMDYDQAAWDKRIAKDPEAVDLLAGYVPELEQASPFQAAHLEAHLKSWLEQKGLRSGRSSTSFEWLSPAKRLASVSLRHLRYSVKRALSFAFVELWRRQEPARQRVLTSDNVVREASIEGGCRSCGLPRARLRNGFQLPSVTFVETNRNGQEKYFRR